MALRVIDSFDWESNLTDRYEVVTLGAQPVDPVLTAAAIDASTGMVWSRGSINAAIRHVQKLIAGGDTTYIVGFWLNVTNEPDSNVVIQLMSIMEGATVHAELLIVPTTASNFHQIRVARSGTTLATGGTHLNQGTAYYIEFKATIGDSGSYELRINGALEVASGSADTRNGGTGVPDRIRIGTVTSANNYRIAVDDLYVCDSIDTGDGCTDFLGGSGGLKVTALFPNGAGDFDDFDTQGSATNYQNVDEHPVFDSGQSFNVGFAVDDEDTYALDNLASNNTIVGLAYYVTGRTDPSSVVKYKPVYRQATEPTDTDYLGDEITLTSSWNRIYTEMKSINPATGQRWTTTELNKTEFGVRVTSVDATPDNPYYVSAGALNNGTGSPVNCAFMGNIDGGDLIVLIVRAPSGRTVTASGFSALTDFAGAGVRIYAMTKRATGTESGNLAVNISGSTGGQRCVRMYLIKRVPFSGSGVWDVASIASAAGTGTSIPDTGVTADAGGHGRAAVNFIVSSVNQAVGAFTGQTGGTWSSHDDAGISNGSGTTRMSAQDCWIDPGNTINGGAVTVGASCDWGVLGIALVGTDQSCRIGQVFVEAAQRIGENDQIPESTSVVWMD